MHRGTGTCSATAYSNRRNPGFLGWLFRRGTDARVDFTVEAPPGTRIDVSSVNGGLTITAQSPVRARTVNGSILVATAIGPVEATTVNGDVDARMTTIGDARGAGRDGEDRRQDDAVAAHRHSVRTFRPCGRYNWSIPLDLRS